MNELVPTIPRIYTALAQWISCVLYLSVYREQLRKRGAACVSWALVFLLLLSAELVLTADAPVVFWIPAMAGSAIIMYLFLKTCMNMPRLNVGYYCVRAFMLSEFAAALAWQLYCYRFHVDINANILRQFFEIMFIYAVVFVAMYFLERKCSQGITKARVHLPEFLAVLVMCIAIFTLSNLSFITPNSPFSSTVAVEIFNIRTFTDLMGVSVLFAYHMQRQSLQAHYELDTIHSILETQYAQYKQSRESIDLVNQKYHDLKHQINVLRAETDEQRRTAWLDAMESDILSYEAQSKTGNSILDTILTSKLLYCQKHNISLTYVVDGAALNFISAMDLCAIFGNALDNAIEAVLKLEDKDKRLIHLTVVTQKGFVLIHVENYYEGSLIFDGRNPMSTKNNDRFHGFGVRSIRYSADQYEGTVNISANKNWFDLKVLIPIP